MRKLTLGPGTHIIFLTTFSSGSHSKDHFLHRGQSKIESPKRPLFIFWPLEGADIICQSHCWNNCTILFSKFYLTQNSRLVVNILWKIFNYKEVPALQAHPKCATHTTAFDWHWGGNGTLKWVLICLTNMVIMVM